MQTIAYRTVPSSHGARAADRARLGRLARHAAGRSADLRPIRALPRRLHRQLPQRRDGGRGAHQSFRANGRADELDPMLAPFSAKRLDVPARGLIALGRRSPSRSKGGWSCSLPEPRRPRRHSPRCPKLSARSRSGVASAPYGPSSAVSIARSVLGRGRGRGHRLRLRGGVGR
jgi:hypothetical protein